MIPATHLGESAPPLLTEPVANRALFRPDWCCHQHIEAQVERTPDAVALVCAERRLSYRQLNQQANQLAHLLRGAGVGPGVLVGLCLERSIEMVVSILGVLKAGGSYTPLDPAYSQERLAGMIADARLALLLTRSELAAGL